MCGCGASGRPGTWFAVAPRGAGAYGARDWERSTGTGDGRRIEGEFSYNVPNTDRIGIRQSRRRLLQWRKVDSDRRLPWKTDLRRPNNMFVSFLAVMSSYVTT